MSVSISKCLIIILTMSLACCTLSLVKTITESVANMRYPIFLQKTDIVEYTLTWNVLITWRMFIIPVGSTNSICNYKVESFSQQYSATLRCDVNKAWNQNQLKSIHHWRVLLQALEILNKYWVSLLTYCKDKWDDCLFHPRYLLSLEFQIYDNGFFDSSIWQLLAH